MLTDLSVCLNPRWCFYAVGILHTGSLTSHTVFYKYLWVQTNLFRPALLELAGGLSSLSNVKKCCDIWQKSCFHRPTNSLDSQMNAEIEICIVERIDKIKGSILSSLPYSKLYFFLFCIGYFHVYWKMSFK